MKVFLSWSGAKSHKVALVFRDWLPSVIQEITPYVSSEDIDKGARWSTDIAKELEDSTFGMLCVTKENISAPWLTFEAGALSKTMDKSFVSPFLLAVFANRVGGSRGEPPMEETGWHGAVAPSHSGARNEETRVESDHRCVAADDSRAAQGGSG